MTLQYRLQKAEGAMIPRFHVYEFNILHERTTVCPPERNIACCERAPPPQTVHLGSAYGLYMTVVKEICPLYQKYVQS